MLRPSGSATVVFHASKPAVWHALGDAFRLSALAVDRTSVLDKTQVSFKQVVHEGGTRGDAVFLLRPIQGAAVETAVGVDSVDDVVATLESAAAGDPEELMPRRMYSRYVARCVEARVPVDLTASEFYAYVAETRGIQGVA